MSVLTLGPFAGMRPRVSPMALDPTNSQNAVNTKLWSGELRPFFANALVKRLGNVGRINTIYELEDYWLVSGSAFDLTPNMLADEVSNRTYFTVDNDLLGNNPRVINTEMIEEAIADDYYVDMYGPDAEYEFDPAVYLNPPDEFDGLLNGSGWNIFGMNEESEPLTDIFYTLGVPAPETAPTAVVGSGGSGEEKTFLYCYTYVNEWGEEGVDSPYSDEVTALYGQLVTLTFPTDPLETNHVPVEFKRIYRMNTTSDGEPVFQFLADIPMSQAEYADTVSDSDLGEALSTQDFDTPPEDLYGMIMHPAGYLIGFRDKEICFSEPGMFYAWPKKYRLTTDFKIIGGGVVGNTVAVLTTAFPYLVYGSDPQESYRHKVPANFGCMNRRGIVSTEYGVVYPSKTGLCLINDSGAITNLTERELTIDEWRKYVLGFTHGVIYDGRYYGFYENEWERGAFILDPSEALGTFVKTDFYTSAGWVKPDTSEFFLQDGVADSNAVVEFEGDKLRTRHYTWKSKKFAVPPVNLAAGKFDIGVNNYTKEEIEKAIASIAGPYYRHDIVESYSGALNGAVWNLFDYHGDHLSPALFIDIFNFDVTLIMYADRQEVFRQKITDTTPFRMPTGYKAMEGLEFQLEGTANVQRVLLGTSIEEVVYAQ